MLRFNLVLLLQIDKGLVVGHVGKLKVRVVVLELLVPVRSLRPAQKIRLLLQTLLRQLVIRAAAVVAVRVDRQERADIAPGIVAGHVAAGGLASFWRFSVFVVAADSLFILRVVGWVAAVDLRDLLDVAFQDELVVYDLFAVVVAGRVHVLRGRGSVRRVIGGLLVPTGAFSVLLNLQLLLLVEPIQLFVPLVEGSCST